jgi:hypothetical protein
MLHEMYSSKFISYQSAIEGAEVKYVRSVNRCTKIDRLKNVGVRSELQIF